MTQDDSKTETTPSQVPQAASGETKSVDDGVTVEAASPLSAHDTTDSGAVESGGRAIILDDRTTALSADRGESELVGDTLDADDPSEEITITKDAIKARNSEETDSMTGAADSRQTFSQDSTRRDSSNRDSRDSSNRDSADKDWTRIIVRFLFLAGYGLIAWAMTWVIFILTLANFIIYAIKDNQNGTINKAIKGLSAQLANIYRYFVDPDASKPFLPGGD